LKTELNDHKVDSVKATRELMDKERDLHNDKHDGHKQTMAEMEAKLRNDLMKLADSHEQKHSDLKKHIMDVNDQHHEKHVQNASKIEEGISKTLDSTHKKLQEELNLLKNSQDGSHGSLREILMEVTRQVDAIDEALQKEQKARLSVEDRLDKSCSELRRDINDSLQESHAALRMELASHSRNADEMKAAMMDAHRALKGELNDHKAEAERSVKELQYRSQQAHGETQDIHKKGLTEMEDKLRKDLMKLADNHAQNHMEMKKTLDNINDTHHDKHAQNAAKIEEGISGAISSTHKKLQEELSLLKDSHGNNHASLREVLMEVTKQVDVIDNTLSKEQKARLAVEERLDKTTNELRRDVTDSLREAHAALRMELASHGKNTEEMKAAMTEAHRALKAEMNDHKVDSERSTRDLILKERQAQGQTHDVHKKSMSEIEDRLRKDLQKLADNHEKKHQDLKKTMDAVDDKHHEKHAANAAKIEEGISKSLDSTHKKLQEEMRLLKDSHGTNHGSLREILMEVTKQVDVLDQTLEREQKARLAVEERLDKTCGEMRRDITDSLRESHAALKMELATHGGNAEEMKSAMMEAHRALKNELYDHKVEAENKAREERGRQEDTHAGHKQSMREIEDKLREDLRKLHDGHEEKHGETRDMLRALNQEHHEKHVQNAQALETGLASMLSDTHKKLTDEINALKSGVDGNHGSMREILMEVTKQVDVIDEALAKEQKLRIQVEERLEKTTNDLQRGIEESMNEAHAALRLELAAQSKDKDEMKAAMQEAHNALKAELTDHKEAASDKHEVHAQTMQEMEDKLRGDLQALADGHSEKHGEMKDMMESLDKKHHERHLQNEAALEEGISRTLDAAHGKLQEELSQLRSGVDGNHGNLREILIEVTKQVDVLDKALAQEQNMRLAVEERVDQACSVLRTEIEEQLQDHKAAAAQAHEDTHGSFHGKLSDVEQRLSQAMDELAGNHKDMITQLNDTHHERHANTEKALEAGLQNVLDQTHGKLANDLELLRSGVDGNHINLRQVLTEVTEQVESLTSSLQAESGLRVAVEEKLEKDVGDLKRDLEDVFKEAHAALKMELAVQTKDADALKDAMADAHQALRQELADHKDSFEKAHASHVDNHAISMSELENQLKTELAAVAQVHDDNHGQLRDALRTINDEHHEKHAQNREALERGIQDALSQTHDKLARDIMELQSGVSDGHLNFRQILTDVTKQVDVIDNTLAKEQEMRVAVEENLERACAGLRQDLEVAISEAHAALRLELADHGKNTAEMEAAMKEAHVALQGELNLHKTNLDQATDQLHGGLSGKLGTLQNSLSDKIDDLYARCQANADQLRSAAGERVQLKEGLISAQRERERLNAGLASAQDERRQLRVLLEQHSAGTREAHGELTEMYTNTNRALEEGLDSVLSKTHEKLALDLRNLASGVEGTQGGLREIVTEVTKEVDALTYSLQAEKGLRQQMEEKLRESIAEIRRDLEDVFREAHAALRLELASQSKDSREVKAALQDAHEALKSEMIDHKGRLDQSASDHIDRHEDMRSRVQSELLMLKTGLESQNNGLRDRLAELTGQIDGLTASLHAEQTMRADVEERLEQRTLALEHRMRTEIQETVDEAQAKNREHNRELRDAMHNFNNENHARHLKLQGMIDSSIQAVLLNADQKMRRSLEELREGIETHHTVLRENLEQERNSREATEQKLNMKVDESLRAIREDQEALRKNVHQRGLSPPKHAGQEPQVGWEEEIRRVWEAIDTHTHDVAVEDVEEERPVRHQILPAREAPLVPTLIAPATPMPAVTRISSRSPPPIARHYHTGNPGSDPALRVIPPTPLLPTAGLGSSVTALPFTANTGITKCGNCPNTLTATENFCNKCGWEKPLHGPPLAGTKHILHNN